MRQLLGKRAARGPKPVTVLRNVEGLLASDREGLVACWQAMFVTEFLGHATVEAMADAREAVGKLVDGFPPHAGVAHRL